MALIALKNQEKDLLFMDPNFRNEVEWAMINKARYWVQLDGTSVPNNDRINWAKNRLLSNTIIGSSIDREAYSRLFLLFTTQQVHNVADDAQGFNKQAVIDYMVTNLIFEALADSVFSEKIKEIKF